MVPGALQYIVLTFFTPPIARQGTTLVPPIVRPEIASAHSVDGDHLVVYSSGEKRMLDALRSTGVRCLVYGSFQPFLEALRGYEVTNLTAIPTRDGDSA